MNELTTEDKERIFAMYLGTEIKVADSKKQYKLVGVSEGFCNVRGSQRVLKSRSVDICKLHLYDLSDISDEDAIEIAMLVGLTSHYCKVIRMEDAIFLEEDTYQFQISHSGYCCMRKNEHLYNLNIVPVIDFLRSNSYMIPYKRKNLFDAGIAVRKTR